MLLAGLYAQGQTTVIEPAVTRDHTERMLLSFGCRVDAAHGEIRLTPPQRLDACSLEVPGDFSSSAFFMVAGSIGTATLTIAGVGVNPTRTGLLDILGLMGADLRVVNHRSAGAEPVADIEVRPAALQGIRVPEHLVPLAIDEFPALFVAAACAEGETVVTGAEELRVKESDRIAVMAEGLVAMGVACEVLPDGIRIQGRPGPAGVLRRYRRQPWRPPDRDVVCGRQRALAGPDPHPRRGERRHLVPGLPRRRAGGRPDRAGSRIDQPHHHHRRAERLRQGHDLAPGRRPPRLAPARQRRAVSPRGLCRPAAQAWTPTTRQDTLTSPSTWTCSSASGRTAASRSGWPATEVSRAIRTEQAGEGASRVAAMPAVRAALLDRQRAFAGPPGLVADGRDMGTVVFPAAALKIFLTASAEERARRRYNQLKDKGLGANLAALSLEIAERDRRDATRAVAPLRPADDAVIVDSTAMTIDAVVARVLELAARGVTQVASVACTGSISASPDHVIDHDFNGAARDARFDVTTPRPSGRL